MANICHIIFRSHHWLTGLLATGVLLLFFEVLDVNNTKKYINVFAKPICIVYFSLFLDTLNTLKTDTLI